VELVSHCLVDCGETHRPAIRVSRHSVHLKQARDLQQWYAACIVELYRPRPETWILIPLDF
jgi:hypothetical protein